MPAEYTAVTENPGDLITSEALQMVVTRYSLATQHSQDRDVLEVGCGPGVGLGYLAQKARRVVGGDFDANMIRAAQHTYRGRVGVVHLDAHALPFADRSFDVALLYEAIYYLPEPGRFLDECKRVLREHGMLIVCTANKSWSDFNPSPFSTAYHSAPELFALLTEHGFQTELFGAFPTTTDSLSRKAVSLIKRTAVYFHLIPKSMKGKEWLKRIFYGRLVPLPAELSPEPAQGLPEGQAEPGALMPISVEAPTGRFKVLYAVGRLPHASR
ncbi:MAG: class I SAM-dependent methyltransferase [Chloroflexi bacterium]|nr:class I SAM-dependent methyltransferase [Chloroflexota bacterium]